MDRVPGASGRGAAGSGVGRCVPDVLRADARRFSQNALLERDGAKVWATAVYDGTSRTLSLVPLDELAPGTAHVVRILPAVTDMAGNPVAPGVLGWPFRTSDL